MTFNPIQLFNSPRRLAAVVIVLAIGLLFWGRLLIHDVPRTAVADPEHKAAFDGSQAGKPSGSEVIQAAKSAQIPADDLDRKP